MTERRTMTSKRSLAIQLILYSIVATLFVIVAGSVANAAVVYRFDPREGKEDLLLVGFGELTFHTLDVDGNVSAFENANPWLKKDFAASYRASLFTNGNLGNHLHLNGTGILDSRIDDEYRPVDPNIFRLRMSLETTEPLWDTWRFTGQGTFDPHNIWEFDNLDSRLLTQPQEEARLELHARLESDEHGYLEGGTLQPSFSNSRFTLHRRSIFGVYANLKDGPVGVETVAGKLEGRRFREGDVVGIRANGTAGPFELVNAPVIRGSEEVRIEIRDRFNQSTLRRSAALTRDVDYTIDYLRGRIILNKPVGSETDEQDPIYIVITYDYQREENDDIVGGRVRVDPTDASRVGAAYLYRNIDDGSGVAGIPEPKGLYSASAAVRHGKAGASVEVAGSDNPNTSSDYSALHGDFSFSPTDRLSFKADYQRIEDDFRSFTNSSLNPTKNQQRIWAQAAYRLSRTGGVAANFSQYQTLDSSGQFNASNGRLDEKVYRLTYNSTWTGGPQLELAYEHRDIENRDDISLFDRNQNRIIADLRGWGDSVGVLGDVHWTSHYEFYTQRNNLHSALGDANTNQIAFSVTSVPADGYRIQLTPKFRFEKNVDTDLWSDREDALFTNIQLRPFEPLSFLVTTEYKRFSTPGNELDVWQDDVRRIDRAGALAVEYLPFEKIKALGRYTRYQQNNWWTDSTGERTDDFIFGQLTWFQAHHLSFSAETEYRRTLEYIAGRDEMRTFDLGARINWNRTRFDQATIGVIRRWEQSIYPPNPEITATSYILLVSGAAGFGNGFFGRGSFKASLLNEPINDDKTIGQLEIGYEYPKYFRVSIGWERFESEADNRPDEYYRGQGLFLRLVGKM